VTGLDEHQARRWTSWYRWVSLAMLASAILGTTSLYGTLVQRNTGSGGGGIATGNNNVTLRVSIVSNNTPNDRNPLNTIPGCVN